MATISSTLQDHQKTVTSIGSHIGDTASLADIVTTINADLNVINNTARGATVNGINLLAVNIRAAHQTTILSVSQAPT